ncbi:THAP domain-containing protein 2-like [Leptopilina boulardi]|uniref:THAP domain-containing protein 2-like n=1 Tax=Leptopilina boulardi TaxID=63433 RepID=UPI0021F52FB3|nr:THAP domain-containing protein 2-like [Leptopilina boulardi]
MSRNCAVKGCKNEKEKCSHQLFRLPDNDEDRNKWLSSIGDNLNRGRYNRVNIFVCELHFEKNCFYNNKIILFKDGNNVELKRKILRLKLDSIPSIFEVILH